jgi:hypothetical protein
VPYLCRTPAEKCTDKGAPMQPYEQNIVTFRMMLGGLDEALDRLQAAVQQRDSSAAFPPLFESLNWAVALDDRIGEHWAPWGKTLATKWRDEVAAAAVMAGVRFARNRVHHQWADALVLNDGIPFPMPFPIPFFGWMWRAADELPPDGNRQGEDVYRERLQGEPAHAALVELQEAFHWVGGLLEPPRPNGATLAEPGI